MSFLPKLDIEQDATDETVGYKPKGYKLNSEYYLKCPSCMKKLVSILVVKTDCPCLTVGGKEINEIKVRTHCPKCKVDTFFLPFLRSKLYWQGVEPFSIIDIEQSDDYSTVLLKVKNYG